MLTQLTAPENVVAASQPKRQKMPSTQRCPDPIVVGKTIRQIRVVLCKPGYGHRRGQHDTELLAAELDRGLPHLALSVAREGKHTQH